MKYSYNKSFKIIGGFVLSALMLAACDDKETNVGDKGVEVTVSSEIVAMTGTQPSDGQWKANDAIGLFMVKAGKGIVVNMASNQKFVTPGDGGFGPAQGKVTFPISGEKVDFLSYAPYRDLVYDFIYPIALKDQLSVPAAPLMYADRVRDRDAGAPHVKFSFRHQLAKLVVKVSAGEGILNLDGLSVRIKGMNTEAEFDLLEGTLDVKPSVADIVPAQAGTAVFQALLLPTETNLTPDHVVDFTIPGNTYTWNMADEIEKIEKAKVYEFDIAVDRAGINVSGTITDWVDTDWEDVSAGNN